MPFVADLTDLAQDVVSALGPYLRQSDFPDTKSGSGH
jgi:hypothetical protein